MTMLSCAPPDRIAGTSMNSPRTLTGTPPPAPEFERSRLFTCADGDHIEDAGVMVVTGGPFSRTESFESVRRVDGGRTVTSVIVGASGSYRVEGCWTYRANDTAAAAQGLADYGGVPTRVDIRVADAVATIRVHADNTEHQLAAPCRACLIDLSPSALPMFTMVRLYDPAQGAVQSFDWIGRGLIQGSGPAPARFQLSRHGHQRDRPAPRLRRPRREHAAGVRDGLRAACGSSPALWGTRGTFPIALQARGLSALRAIPGLETAVAEQGVWCYGAVMHSRQGKPRTFDRKSPLLIIDRNRLTVVLLQQLLEHDRSSAVTVRFDCPCTAVDRDGQRVTLQPAQGPPLTARYDCLVAADGVSSQVRGALAAAAALQCQETIAPDRYKLLFVPRVSPDRAFEVSADRMHGWLLADDIRVVTAPQADDWLHGTLIFPAGRNPLEDLPTMTAVEDYLRRRCPTLARLMRPEEITVLRQRPVSEVRLVQCDRMHVGDSILLIGDAVHAVSPSVGQGCNASLQDVQVFSRLLDQYADDWSQTLPAFTAERLPEAVALRDLSDYSVPRSKRMRFEYLLRLLVSTKLRRWLPTWPFCVRNSPPLNIRHQRSARAGGRVLPTSQFHRCRADQRNTSGSDNSRRENLRRCLSSGGIPATPAR
jgi:kynurenine 3-monooxygenase